ncbi:acetyl-hydrolase, putative [Talaromyces stipitatus ATCC 10500]|uniref:Acetyl-hydrolase, putative n=1 Tax=Talaromyces stipitatus (strain ATCC 10500 / CBS 375.48 / QM 6759 / NRRL 1006) TaxID=441959 RepID=B8MAJ3_TALSN|nr:acetyl-hydrolase, putative [Talaromyces stipitatus ATCC 10500]EED17417.1 acetyl-hydrolase, putative [Talaromyces stipitatus ATCC 10500]
MTDNWDPAKPLVARQPLKFVYILYYILTSAVSVPTWAILYGIPFLRPVSSWSYKTALVNKISYHLLKFLSMIRIQTPQPITPGNETDLFVVLEPAKDLKKTYTGLLDNPQIQPTTVGAFWIPNLKHLASATSSTNSNWIILHFHGGAYVLLTPRDPAVQRGPRQLCEELPADAALCLDYRLSSKPKSSYPAQLQDALTAYNYLIHDQQISPSRILVSGDSAGAHLAITFLRHLTTHPESGLPLPRALLLHSPWLDLTEKKLSVDNIQKGRDYVSDAFVQWGATTFTPAGSPRDAEFVSPFYHPFTSPIPIWVQAGGVETLYATIVEWVNKMRNAGSAIELYTMEDMPHDVFHLSTGMGLETEARKALRAAKAFLIKDSIQVIYFTQLSRL